MILVVETTIYIFFIISTSCAKHSFDRYHDSLRYSSHYNILFYLRVVRTSHHDVLCLNHCSNDYQHQSSFKISIRISHADFEHLRTFFYQIECAICVKFFKSSFHTRIDVIFDEISLLKIMFLH